MFKGSNCDRKSQLSGISTEPLNPCGRAQEFPRISGPSPPRRSGTVFFFEGGEVINVHLLFYFSSSLLLTN